MPLETFLLFKWDMQESVAQIAGRCASQQNRSGLIG